MPRPRWRGCCKRDVGRRSRARLRLRQALVSRSPRQISHRIELANLQIELGAKEAAAATLRVGTTLQPESAELQRAQLALGEPA